MGTIIEFEYTGGEWECTSCGTMNSGDTTKCIKGCNNPLSVGDGETFVEDPRRVLAISREAIPELEGVNLTCPRCGGDQPSGTASCPNCGGELALTDTVRRREEIPVYPAPPIRAAISRERERSPNGPRPGRRPEPRGLRLPLIWAAVGLFVAFLLSLIIPVKSADAFVTEVQWKYVVQTKVTQTTTGEGFDLPTNAKIIRQEKRDTGRTRPVQRGMKPGWVEIDTGEKDPATKKLAKKESLANGRFKNTYTYKTKVKKVWGEVPNIVDVPIEADYYFWRLESQVAANTFEDSGQDLSPRKPRYTLKAHETVGGESVTYVVRSSVQGRSREDWISNEADWRRLGTEKVGRARMNWLGWVLSITPR